MQTISVVVFQLVALCFVQAEQANDLANDVGEFIASKVSGLTSNGAATAVFTKKEENQAILTFVIPFNHNGNSVKIGFGCHPDKNVVSCFGARCDDCGDVIDKIRSAVYMFANTPSTDENKHFPRRINQVLTSYFGSACVHAIAYDKQRLNEKNNKNSVCPAFADVQQYKLVLEKELKQH